MNRRLFILGIAGLVALAGATLDANAACNPTKDFATAFISNNVYIDFPAGADSTIGGGNLIGRFWQAGNRSAANEGTACPEITYMLDLGGPLAIFGQSGGDILGTGPCDNAGCVTGTQFQLVQTRSTDGTNAYYVAAKVNGSAGDSQFDFGRGAGPNWQMQPMPRPRVTSSTRSAPNVVLDLSFDAPNGRGESDSFPAESIVTGYELVRFTGTADPGRSPGAWTSVETLTTTASGASLAGLSVDCSNTANDVFLAVRPVFDNGQFSADYVSASTRIECDPNLADPKGFKLIDKKPKPGLGGKNR